MVVLLWRAFRHLMVYIERIIPDQTAQQHLFGGLSWFIPVLATVGVSVAYLFALFTMCFLTGI